MAVVCHQRNVLLKRNLELMKFKEAINSSVISENWHKRIIRIEVYRNFFYHEILKNVSDPVLLDRNHKLEKRSFLFVRLIEANRFLTNTRSMKSGSQSSISMVSSPAFQVPSWESELF